MLLPMVRFTEEIDLFLQRVARTCAPKPETALALLHETEPLADLVSESHQRTAGGSPLSSFATSQQFATTGEHPFNRLRYLPTGLVSLDDALRGGLRVGTITEIVGRAGAGKTQLAMQLCVMAARHCQGCIYIDTERKMSLPRLQEIAEKRAASGNKASNRSTADTSPATNPHFSYNQAEPFASASALTHDSSQLGLSSSASSHIPYRRPKEVLDNVTVLSPSTTSELLSALVEVEELILNRNDEAIDDAMADEYPVETVNGSNDPPPSKAFPVRLLILDSIAAPTKRGFGNESVAERAAGIFQCAQRLKQLAHQLGLAVLVINQVVLEQTTATGGSPVPAVRNRSPTQHSESVTTMSMENKVFVKAALGTSWHHCVATRIILEQNHQQENYNPYSKSPSGAATTNSAFRATKRTATIVKSNVVGFQSTEFQVVGSGIVGVSLEPSSS